MRVPLRKDALSWGNLMIQDKNFDALAEKFPGKSTATHEREVSSDTFGII